jgi:hypothetical protein
VSHLNRAFTICLIASAAILLSALAGAPLAAIAPDKPAWPMLGFEVVIALAGIIGLFLGFTRPTQSPGLAMLCVAGTVFLCAALGYLSVGGSLGSFPMKLWLLLRLALAAITGAAAAWAVLGSRPGETLPKATVGIALLAPSAAAVGLVVTGTLPKLASLVPASVPSGVLLTAGVLIGTAAAATLCAGVHKIIRAFEIGAESAA